MKRAISIVATIILGAGLMCSAACGKGDAAEQPLPRPAEQFHRLPPPMPRRMPPVFCPPRHEERPAARKEERLSETEEADEQQETGERWVPTPGLPPKKPFPIRPVPGLPKPEL